MQFNRTKNATKNMVFGLILKIYQIAMPFLIRTLFIYIMGVEYLGLNSLFTSILQVLSLAELGVGSAMVYSMYKPLAEDDTETICALMRLYKIYYRIIGLVILVVGLVVTPFLPYLIESDLPADVNLYVLWFLNLASTVVTYWLFAYKNCIISATQRNDIGSKISLVITSLTYAGQILILFLTHNYYLYILVSIFTSLLSNIVTKIVADKMYPQFKPRGKLPKEETKKINHRVKDLFTAKLGTTIVNSADTIVISAFLGLTVLAVYQNYYYIMTSIIGIINIFLDSCKAGIGNSFVIDTSEKRYADFKKFSLMEIWIVGICVCCFLNIYQPFMMIWMGEEYLLSFGFVILMCIYFYVYMTNNYLATYKDAAGMWHEDRFRPLIASLSNLIMNLALVRYIGIYGIVLSTVLSYVLINMPWLFRNIFKCLFKRSSKEYVGKFIYYTLVVCLAAVISYFACLYFNEPSIVCILIRIAFSLLIPNIIFLIFLGHGDDFNGALDYVDKMTKNKLKFITKHLRRK